MSPKEMKLIISFVSGGAYIETYEDVRKAVDSLVNDYFKLAEEQRNQIESINAVRDYMDVHDSITCSETGTVVK